MKNILIIAVLWSTICSESLGAFKPSGAGHG